MLLKIGAIAVVAVKLVASQGLNLVDAIGPFSLRVSSGSLLDTFIDAHHSEHALGPGTVVAQFSAVADNYFYLNNTVEDANGAALIYDYIVASEVTSAGLAASANNGTNIQYLGFSVESESNSFKNFSFDEAGQFLVGNGSWVACTRTFFLTPYVKLVLAVQSGPPDDDTCEEIQIVKA